MTRSAANAHLDAALTDLQSALADASAGDSVYNMIKDLIQRVEHAIVKSNNP